MYKIALHAVEFSTQSLQNLQKSNIYFVMTQTNELIVRDVRADTTHNRYRSSTPFVGKVEVDMEAPAHQYLSSLLLIKNIFIVTIQQF
jgi:hypothetical protein